MRSRPTEQSDAERAVLNYKHALAIRVARHIVILSLRQPYVYPGDVPQDIVEKEHRQGVVSNAWGTLKACEVIVELSPNFSDPAHGIFHGEKCNTNPGAKSRWTGVYRLCSRARALTWLERNGGVPPEFAPAKPEVTRQMMLV